MADADGFGLSIDDLGIATLTLDQPGRSTNIIDDDLVTALGARLDELQVARATLRGVLVVSGKSTFMVGADLFALEQLCAAAPGLDVDALLQRLGSLSRVLRRLETVGLPVACAIEGSALGGGFELALACHWRVVADSADIQIGLPEVQVGLLPGGGGTQRLPRLAGLAAALPLLLEGRSLNPQEALSRGLVDALAQPGQASAVARAWLLSPAATATARWDAKGFCFPGGSGAMDPRSVQLFTGARAMAFARTLGNYPAPEAILSAVFAGSVVSFDRALEVEVEHFTQLFREGTARRMIRTLFINKGRADKLVRRPTDVPPTNFRRIGVLGAGMMGAGIACVAAQAGVEVVLIDRTPASAARGKAIAEQQLARAVQRGRTSEAAARKVLARIQPTCGYKTLGDVQLVIEAVFEDRTVKAAVMAFAEAVMPPQAVFASNTSTLPITGLAAASVRPQQFIGMHFFSPVERMPLVEIVRGHETGRAALAVALDFVRLLRKTPIVVNDGRGFYTTRFVSAYILEGQALLREGMPAALIENAGRLAGMPVGPLALADEVALDLSWQIRQQWRKDLGEQYVEHPGEAVNDALVGQQRFGRKNDRGFYDYPADGGRKSLWAGLAEIFPPAHGLPSSADELGERLLAVQALEAVRCLESGVLEHVDDGDVGAVLGLGFAPFTGGPFSWIEMRGIGPFVERCEGWAQRHGERYRPPKLLLDLVRAAARGFVRT